LGFFHKAGAFTGLCVILAFVAACSTPDASSVSPDGVFDPYEVQNRKNHEFNKGLDRNVIRPVALGYSSVVPDEIETGIGNFASNLKEPSHVVNNVLQGDLRGAGFASIRFVTNSTIGLLGLFDVATEFQIPEHDTDFGETLHVWGAAEGAYFEAPVFGPTTERDAVGRVVDLFINPFGFVASEVGFALNSPEKYVATGTRVASGLSTRARFSDTIDSVLYDSADSYSQTRLFYLQNRRFELGEESAGADIDPFALDTEGF